MEWLETFLRPFTIVYSLMLVYIMDFVLIESRVSKRAYLGLTLLCAGICSMALTMLYQVGGLVVMQNYSIFAVTIPSGIVYYFLSKHRGSRFFLAFCTADMACMASIMLSTCVSILFGGGLMSILLTRLILLTLMTVFVVICVAKPFCHVMNTVQQGWGAAAFVATLFYLLLYGYFMFPSSIEERPVYVPVGILILILLFSCYWFIYKTISGLNEMHLAEKTEQGLRLQIALQKEQYGAIGEKIKVDQIFRHDLRHHARLLAELLAARNFEEALAYTQKLDNYALERTSKNYCENIVVNAVLSSHLGETASLGITVTSKAVLPAVVNIDEMELCVVLSNLLENAIENCLSETTAPTLDISIKENKGQICIRIQNSFGGSVPVLMLLMYVIVFLTFQNTHDLMLKSQTEQSMKLQTALQKEQYKVVQNKIEVDKVFRHDLRHHANLLAGMLTEGKTEEALTYVQKLGALALDRGGESYCENLVVNTVLAYHVERARAVGMTVECKAVVPEQISIDEMELCTVLSNLLENATLHGSGTPPQLSVSILQKKEQLCIRVENSFDGMIVQKGHGNYRSAKPQGGGIGLQSVAAIVKKYEGAMNVSHTAITFTVDIALKPIK